MTALDNLERLRRCVIDTRKLREQLAALSPAPAPIVLDGLPHGAGGTGSIERLIDARDVLQKRLSVLSTEIEIRCKAAEPFLETLPPEQITVTCDYYLRGNTVKETAEYCGVAERRVYERLRKIREAARGMELHGNPEQWGKANGTR